MIKNSLIKNLIIQICCYFASSMTFANDIDTVQYFLRSNVTAPRACVIANNTDPNFCSLFFSNALCVCQETSSTPKHPSECKDMHTYYNYLMFTFQSLSEACHWLAMNVPEPDRVSVQDCVDNWNCYWRGGTNSKGDYCSSKITMPNNCDNLH